MKSVSYRLIPRHSTNQLWCDY